MCESDETSCIIWKKIIDYGIINHPCDDNVKKFMINICSNRFDEIYFNEMIQLIKRMDMEIRFMCYLAMCMFNHDTKIFDRLID
jgi:hypothetical protein